VTTALLVMDMQNGIVERFAERSASLLATLAQTVAVARSASIPVLFVRVAFRDGAPEANARNQPFSTLAKSDTMSENSPATQIHPGVAPLAGEIMITKRRVSAFSGSDLDVVARSLGVDALVLSGIATSGVVLSTLRQAADLDFKITVLSDGCADADPEVHPVLMEKVFPRQATVMTADEWARHVRGA
jgi:nicotinamidase-related amidase